MHLTNVLTVLVPALAFGFVSACVGAEVERYRQNQLASTEPKYPVGETWQEKLASQSHEMARIGRDLSDRTGTGIRWGIGGTVFGFALGLVFAFRAKPGAVPVKQYGPASFDGIEVVRQEKESNT